MSIMEVTSQQKWRRSVAMTSRLPLLWRASGSRYGGGGYSVESAEGARVAEAANAPMAWTKNAEDEGGAVVVEGLAANIA